jgi:hypothetical protein
LDVFLLNNFYRVLFRDPTFFARIRQPLVVNRTGCGDGTQYWAAFGTPIIWPYYWRIRAKYTGILAPLAFSRHRPARLGGDPPQ